jgi:hypothetical protein
MAIPGSSATYPADPYHEIHTGAEYNSVPLQLRPAELSSQLEVAVPALWESIVRVADQLYM